MRHRLQAVVAGGLALLAGASCSKSTQGAAGPGAGARRAPTVNVEPVSVRDVTYKIQAVGSLEAEEIVQVTAEVEGKVIQVLFNEGMRVGPQTPLVRIDPERYRVEAARAEAAYKKAVAERRRAEQDQQRREQLAKEQLVAVEELNRSRGETERLAAEADSAKAAWDIALQNVRRAEVRAPRGGVINTKGVETGQFVKTAHVLATIVDTSRLRLRFKVSEGESLRARPGQPVSFTVAALGSTPFTGEIYHVGEVADPATRQVEVLAWVKNPGVLKPGFFAEVDLASEMRQNAVVVPERAVLASERGFVSYVIDGAKARVRPVKLGIRTGDGGVEILSGLNVGDRIVVEGSDRLTEGMDVQIAGAPAAAGASGAPSGASAR